MKCTCSLNKNGLAMSFSNYKDIVIPKECVGFTDRAYEDFLATATARDSITVENGNTKYKAIGNCLIELETGTVVLGCKNSIIPDDGGIKIIGHHAFSGIGGTQSKSHDIFTAIAIPNSVEVIESYAFFDSGLANVKLPDGLLRLEDLSFGETRIKEIEIPYLATLGVGVFAGCKELKRFIASNHASYIINSDTIVGCDSKRLCAVAMGSGECHIPSYTSYIEELTFYGLKGNCYMEVDEQIEEIYLSNLDLPANVEIPITICAYENSYPIYFAKEHGLKYKILFADIDFSELLDRID